MHEAAISAAKPGNKISAIDRAAREVLARHGYSTRQYGSGCARGLAIYGAGITGGRELKLDLRSYNQDSLTPGMIFSVEPEIRTDAGIFRHSTTVLITQSGSEVWSRIPRGMITV
jgi:Xaa-Pro aminopeptidase